MRKKILFILYSLDVGGAEKQTIALVNALNKDKFEISLVYLDAFDTLLPQINAERLTVLKCLHRQKRLDWQVIKKVRVLIRVHNYDIIACVERYQMVYAFIGRLLSGYRPAIIQILHCTIPKPGIWTRLKNIFIYKRLMNRCEQTVFVCKNQMDYWANRFSIRSDKSTYIYNGIDTEWFTDICSEQEQQHLKASLGFTPDNFIVGICATLRPEKKHTDFIDAIKLARKQAPEISGLIIGDGPLNNEVRRYIQKNGMSSAIKMTGFQNDVRPCISICDCMALTSHAVETFSMAALEAMAMNRPVIMTDLGGAREQIEHGESGFIYEKGDVTSLAGHLCGLAKNRNHLAMGARARERVRHCFTARKMVEAYEKLFSSIR